VALVQGYATKLAQSPKDFVFGELIGILITILRYYVPIPIISKQGRVTSGGVDNPNNRFGVIGEMTGTQIQ
tara:strand:- start:415 stop:627 length:213 start_codon:yes stop_codon:yes gene_type:complete